MDPVPFADVERHEPGDGHVSLRIVDADRPATEHGAVARRGVHASALLRSVGFRLDRVVE